MSAIHDEFNKQAAQAAKKRDAKKKPMRRPPAPLTIGDVVGYAKIKADREAAEQAKQRRAELDDMGFKALTDVPATCPECGGEPPCYCEP